MPAATVNGVRLAYEINGSGTVPLVLVHGSWVSRRSWDPVLQGFAQSCRVLWYDRRGHSESERPTKQGSVHEDVADLAALIEHAGLAPAWVVGSSFGGSIALRLAGTRPELVRGVLAHEPPLLSVLQGDPAATPFCRRSEKRSQRSSAASSPGIMRAPRSSLSMRRPWDPAPGRNSRKRSRRSASRMLRPSWTKRTIRTSLASIPTAYRPVRDRCCCPSATGACRCSMPWSPSSPRCYLMQRSSHSPAPGMPHMSRIRRPISTVPWPLSGVMRFRNSLYHDVEPRSETYG